MSLRPTIKPSIDISSYTGVITKLAPQARMSHQDTTVKCPKTTGSRPMSWRQLIKENKGV